MLALFAFYVWNLDQNKTKIQYSVVKQNSEGSRFLEKVTIRLITNLVSKCDGP